MYNSKNKNLFLQQENFLILKTVKLTIKKYLDIAEDSQGSMAQHFCGNVMVYQKAFGTVWSTSLGPRLPTTDATNSSLPLSLYINMTHELPDKHPISISSEGRKNRKTVFILSSLKESSLFCPDFLEARQHSPASPIKIVLLLLTTEATSSSPRYLKSSNLFFGQLTKFFRSELFQGHADPSSKDQSKYYLPHNL